MTWCLMLAGSWPGCPGRRRVRPRRRRDRHAVLGARRQHRAPGNWVHFAASKAALETLSRGLAKELAADGIRVNAVRPGVIATETRLGQPKDHLDRALGQVPLARMGTAEEVAAAVLWLLSEDASYVSGATLDVAVGYDHPRSAGQQLTPRTAHVNQEKGKSRKLTLSLGGHAAGSPIPYLV